MEWNFDESPEAARFVLFKDGKIAKDGEFYDEEHWQIINNAGYGFSDVKTLGWILHDGTIEPSRGYPPLTSIEEGLVRTASDYGEPMEQPDQVPHPSGYDMPTDPSDDKFFKWVEKVVQKGHQAGSFGKGIQTNHGEHFTWSIDPEEGYPHHEDVLTAFNMEESEVADFESINPDGSIQGWDDMSKVWAKTASDIKVYEWPNAPGGKPYDSVFTWRRPVIYDPNEPALHIGDAGDHHYSVDTKRGVARRYEEGEQPEAHGFYSAEGPEGELPAGTFGFWNKVPREAVMRLEEYVRSQGLEPKSQLNDSTWNFAKVASPYQVKWVWDNGRFHYVQTDDPEEELFHLDAYPIVQRINEDDTEHAIHGVMEDDGYVYAYPGEHDTPEVPQEALEQLKTINQKAYTDADLDTNADNWNFSKTATEPIDVTTLGLEPWERGKSGKGMIYNGRPLIWTAYGPEDHHFMVLKHLEEGERGRFDSDSGRGDFNKYYDKSRRDFKGFFVSPQGSVDWGFEPPTPEEAQGVYTLIQAAGGLGESSSQGQYSFAKVAGPYDFNYVTEPTIPADMTVEDWNKADRPRPPATHASCPKCGWMGEREKAEAGCPRCGQRPEKIEQHYLATGNVNLKQYKSTSKESNLSWDFAFLSSNDEGTCTQRRVLPNPREQDGSNVPQKAAQPPQELPKESESENTKAAPPVNKTASEWKLPPPVEHGGARIVFEPWEPGETGRYLVYQGEQYRWKTNGSWPYHYVAALALGIHDDGIVPDDEEALEQGVTDAGVIEEDGRAYTFSDQFAMSPEQEYNFSSQIAKTAIDTGRIPVIRIDGKVYEGELSGEHRDIIQQNNLDFRQAEFGSRDPETNKTIWYGHRDPEQWESWFEFSAKIGSGPAQTKPDHSYIQMLDGTWHEGLDRNEHHADIVERLKLDPEEILAYGYTTMANKYMSYPSTESKSDELFGDWNFSAVAPRQGERELQREADVVQGDEEDWVEQIGQEAYDKWQFSEDLERYQAHLLERREAQDRRLGRIGAEIDDYGDDIAGKVERGEPGTHNAQDWDTPEGLEPWVGGSMGKALKFPDGREYRWQTIDGIEPGHWDALYALGIKDANTAEDWQAYYVSPKGELEQIGSWWDGFEEIRFGASATRIGSVPITAIGVNGEPTQIKPQDTVSLWGSDNQGEQEADTGKGPEGAEDKEGVSVVKHEGSIAQDTQGGQDEIRDMDWDLDSHGPPDNQPPHGDSQEHLTSSAPYASDLGQFLAAEDWVPHWTPPQQPDEFFHELPDPDPFPRGTRILKLVDGRYVTGSGHHHQLALRNELGVKDIEAYGNQYTDAYAPTKWKWMDDDGAAMRGRWIEEDWSFKAGSSENRPSFKEFPSSISGENPSNISASNPEDMEIAENYSASNMKSLASRIAHQIAGWDAKGLPRPVAPLGDKPAPVPWGQAFDKHGPEWGIIEPKRQEQAINNSLCSLCGEQVEEGAVFVHQEQYPEDDVYTKEDLAIQVVLDGAPLHDRCAVLTGAHCPHIRDGLKDGTVVQRPYRIAKNYALSNSERLASKLANQSIMYHVAPQSAAEDIEAYGLDSASQPTRWNEEEHKELPRGTYFWTTPQLAYHYAQGMNRADIFEVNVENLNLIPDPDQPGDAFYTVDHVPPEYIWLHEEEEYDEPEWGFEASELDPGETVTPKGLTPWDPNNPNGTWGRWLRTRDGTTYTWEGEPNHFEVGHLIGLKPHEFAELGAGELPPKGQKLPAFEASDEANAKEIDWDTPMGFTPWQDGAYGRYLMYDGRYYGWTLDNDHGEPYHYQGEATIYAENKESGDPDGAGWIYPDGTLVSGSDAMPVDDQRDMADEGMFLGEWVFEGAVPKTVFKPSEPPPNAKEGVGAYFTKEGELCLGQTESEPHSAIARRNGHTLDQIDSFWGWYPDDVGYEPIGWGGDKPPVGWVELGNDWYANNWGNDLMGDFNFSNVSESSHTHRNRWTGLLCDCQWGRPKRKRKRSRKIASEELGLQMRKLLKAPDKKYKTPEGQAFLEALKETPDEYDSILPYVAQRWKKGDVTRSDTGLNYTAPYGDRPLWDKERNYGDLPQWHQFFEARQHPSRQGVNVMDPKFDTQQMVEKVGEHQESLREAKQKENYFLHYGNPHPELVKHTFGSEAGKYKGWHVVQLDGEQAEGDSEALGHCIGSYDQPYRHNIEEGNIDAYSLRDADGFPKASWHNNPSGDGIGHMQGRSGYPKEEYRNLITQFNEHHELPDHETHEEELEGQYDAEVEVDGPDTIDEYLSHFYYGEFGYEAAIDAGYNAGPETEIYVGEPDWSDIAYEYLSGHPKREAFERELANQPEHRVEISWAMNDHIDHSDSDHRQMANWWNSEVARGSNDSIDLPAQQVSEVDVFNEAHDEGEEPEISHYGELANDYLNHGNHYRQTGHYDQFHNNFQEPEELHPELVKQYDPNDRDHQIAAEHWDAQPGHEDMQLGEATLEPNVQAPSTPPAPGALGEVRPYHAPPVQTFSSLSKSANWNFGAANPQFRADKVKDAQVFQQVPHVSEVQRGGELGNARIIELTDGVCIAGNYHHPDLMLWADLKPEDIKRMGWQLENGDENGWVWMPERDIPMRNQWAFGKTARGLSYKWVWEGDKLGYVDENDPNGFFHGSIPERHEPEALGVMGPDGAVEFYDYYETTDEVKGRVVEELKKLNPNAHYKEGYELGWTLAKTANSRIAGMTLPQEIRAWDNASFLQEHSPVVHQFEDGWTVKHHQDEQAVRSVGAAMKNCWQGKSSFAPDGTFNQQHHALHDEHDIPRVAFYWQPVDGVEPDDPARVLHEPLGTRNKAPEAHQLDKLWEFASTASFDPRKFTGAGEYESLKKEDLYAMAGRWGELQETGFQGQIGEPRAASKTADEDIDQYTEQVKPGEMPGPPPEDDYHSWRGLVLKNGTAHLWISPVADSHADYARLHDIAFDEVLDWLGWDGVRWYSLAYAKDEYKELWEKSDWNFSKVASGWKVIETPEEGGGEDETERPILLDPDSKTLYIGQLGGMHHDVHINAPNADIALAINPTNGVWSDYMSLLGTLAEEAPAIQSAVENFLGTKVEPVPIGGSEAKPYGIWNFGKTASQYTVHLPEGVHEGMGDPEYGWRIPIIIAGNDIYTGNNGDYHYDVTGDGGERIGYHGEINDWDYTGFISGKNTIDEYGEHGEPGPDGVLVYGMEPEEVEQVRQALLPHFPNLCHIDDNEAAGWNFSLGKVKKVAVDPEALEDGCPIVELHDGTVIGGEYGFHFQLLDEYGLDPATDVKRMGYKDKGEIIWYSESDEQRVNRLQDDRRQDGLEKRQWNFSSTLPKVVDRRGTKVDHGYDTFHEGDQPPVIYYPEANEVHVGDIGGYHSEIMNRDLGQGHHGRITGDGRGIFWYEPGDDPGDLAAKALGVVPVRPKDDGSPVDSTWLEDFDQNVKENRGGDWTFSKTAGDKWELREVDSESPSPRSYHGEVRRPVIFDLDNRIVYTGTQSTYHDDLLDALDDQGISVGMESGALFNNQLEIYSPEIGLEQAENIAEDLGLKVVRAPWHKAPDGIPESQAMWSFGKTANQEVVHYPETASDQGNEYHPVVELQTGEVLLGGKGGFHADLLQAHYGEGEPVDQLFFDRDYKSHGYVEHYDDEGGSWLNWYDEPNDPEGTFEALKTHFPDLKKEGEEEQQPAWTFAKTSHQLGWVPGTWGKGLATNDDIVHTWATDEAGDSYPAHYTYKNETGLDRFDEDDPQGVALENEFWISPEGKISFYHGLSEKEDVVVQADPNFEITSIPNSEAEFSWEFTGGINEIGYRVYHNGELVRTGKVGASDCDYEIEGEPTSESLPKEWTEAEILALVEEGWEHGKSGKAIEFPAQRVEWVVDQWGGPHHMEVQGAINATQRGKEIILNPDGSEWSLDDTWNGEAEDNWNFSRTVPEHRWSYAT